MALVCPNNLTRPACPFANDPLSGFAGFDEITGRGRKPAQARIVTDALGQYAGAGKMAHPKLEDDSRTTIGDRAYTTIEVIGLVRRPQV